MPPLHTGTRPSKASRAGGAGAGRISTTCSGGPSARSAGWFCPGGRIMYADVCFPARGEVIPTDHPYLTLAARSRVVPSCHQPGGPRFAAINGDRGPKGHIRLFERSRLRVRLSADQVAAVLPLAGRTLDVAGHAVRLGTPTVAPLEPAP